MNKQIVARKSWLAYVVVSVSRLVMLTVVALVVLVASRSPALVALTVVLGLAWLAFGIAQLRSYALWFDDDGVWLYRGIMPWSRGANGIRWRDIGGATCSTGVSWSTGSQRRRLSSRPTWQMPASPPAAPRGS